MNVKCYSRKDFFDKISVTDETVGTSRDYYICINATANIHSVGYFKQNHKNVLDLKFDDVDKDMLKTYGPEENYICYALACTEKQARQIVSFVEQIPEDAAVHIYCTKGQSRSVAVVNFIEKFFNKSSINIEGQNEHVFNLLKKVYEEYK